MLQNLLRNKNMPLYSLIAFGVLFLLDVFLTYKFTATSLVWCCMLLVLETIIAVCFDEFNYAGLLIVAGIQLIVGLISKNFLLIFLCLALYFAALFAIHMIRMTSKGTK